MLLAICVCCRLLVVLTCCLRFSSFPLFPYSLSVLLCTHSFVLLFTLPLFCCCHRQHSCNHQRHIRSLHNGCGRPRTHPGHNYSQGHSEKCTAGELFCYRYSCCFLSFLLILLYAQVYNNTEAVNFPFFTYTQVMFLSGGIFRFFTVVARYFLFPAVFFEKIFLSHVCLA